MTTREAIEHLTKELELDHGYFYSWQSNIAMAFKDECTLNGISFPQMHDISNAAAKRFLKILMTDVSTPTNEKD